MIADLLKDARQKAEGCAPDMRLAALLWIAHAESRMDAASARQTLFEALQQLHEATAAVRPHMVREARYIAAAIAPEYLGQIPEPPSHFGGFPKRMETGSLLQVMLRYGQVDAAFDYTMHRTELETFPFLAAGGLVHKLDAERALLVLRRAVEAWRGSTAVAGDRSRDEFVQFFAHFWQKLPPGEAQDVLQEILAEAFRGPDGVTHCGYPDEIVFTSQREHTLFQMLYALRVLEPALVESLVASHGQLEVAARRFPDGLETMKEEAEAAAARHKASGATCEGGFIFAGDPSDFDEERAQAMAARAGDFGPMLNGVLVKYARDVSPETTNQAPKMFWPSTSAARTLLHQAGERIGADAAALLTQMPDEDLRMFAAIELAAALSGVSMPGMTTMTQPKQRRFEPGQVGSSKALMKPAGMRSPDGRAIRCPGCGFELWKELTWGCRCGHVWNTFDTAGKCPGCGYQWTETQCVACGGMFDHADWYVDDKTA
jgi:hypothetical protein